MALDRQPTVAVVAAQREKMEMQFVEAANQRLMREKKAADDRRKAELSSLTEEVRQLLVEAVYVELALASHRDLFDEGLLLDFSEQAYQRLKRHKMPFAGAIKLIGSGLSKPRPDDSLYVRLQESKNDVLTRRFEAIRGKLTNRLRELVEMKKKMDVPGQVVGSSGEFELRLNGISDDHSSVGPPQPATPAAGY